MQSCQTTEFCAAAYAPPFLDNSASIMLVSLHYLAKESDKAQKIRGNESRTCCFGVNFITDCILLVLGQVYLELFHRFCSHRGLNVTTLVFAIDQLSQARLGSQRLPNLASHFRSPGRSNGQDVFRNVANACRCSLYIDEGVLDP